MTRVSSSTRRMRLVAVPVAAVLGVSGLAACGDSAGPDRGEVTTEDLQGLEDDMAALEDRMGAFEDAQQGVEETGGDVGADFWNDTESLIGQQGTVSAAVSEVVVSGDSGVAFRIAGESGEPIAVVSASPPAMLEVDDLVQVSGTVMRIQRDTFEEDFGVAEGDLFDDPDAFFEEAEGQVAIAADVVQVMQEQASE